MCMPIRHLSGIPDEWLIYDLEVQGRGPGWSYKFVEFVSAYRWNLNCEAGCTY